MNIIDRFLNEFAAQDCGTLMKIFHKGDHILVARFLEGNQIWAPTKEGLEFLAKEDAAALELTKSTLAEGDPELTADLKKETKKKGKGDKDATPLQPTDFE